MIVRYVKSLVKGNDLDIRTESGLVQYVTDTTKYTSSNDSVAYWEFDDETEKYTGVIHALSAGNAILTATREDGDGVEINLSSVGIDIDYQKSNAKKVGNKYVVDFEDETEIKFSAVTPNHIIRAKVVDANDATISGLEIVQPTDTTVIVKATSGTKVSGTVKLELINRHSEYVGEITEVKTPYTNIYNERITKTYHSTADDVPPTKVYRGVKVWDSENKCYRYIQSDTYIDPETGEQKQFVEETPLEPTHFYESVYQTSIDVTGVKLPNDVALTISDFYEVTALEQPGGTGVITITDAAALNVTADSVRLDSWPMDLEFRPNQTKTGFVFDLNSAIPYNYKLKLTYKKQIVDTYNVNVLGKRLIISNRPVITNTESRTKAYIVKVGEVSAIEFYSNPVIDVNYLTYTTSDPSIELFNVGTVKLARFNEIGDFTITATYNDGKGAGQEHNIATTINVTVVDDLDSIDTEDQDPKNDVKVTFVTNGGSKVNPDNYVIIDAGTILSKPRTKKSGYKFGGWFTDDVLTTEWDFSKVVTKDMTLYAKWTKITTDAGAGQGESQGDGNDLG